MSFFVENGRNIFRLAVILCLVFTVMPGYVIKQQEASAAEEGIGGGIPYEEIISGTEDGNLPPLESLESAVLEQESFSKNHIFLYDSYTVKSGDNISTLAVNFGLNQDTIISVNKVTNTRLLQIGKVLKIPNQDGILHVVRSGDTLDSIANGYKADSQAIKIANELFTDNIKAGTDLFIPGARLDWVSLQEINGDLFVWPISGAITSSYGYRINPFNSSQRQFHTGIDIRGSTGTPIRAAMAGRVSQVGYDSVLGNYVIINHHSGYRTLYGHMSVIRARTGAYVAVGERIGDVGSTGQSTGPHLHFTVYKNGVTVNPLSLMR
ncbi:MAG: M23 family metallopeptidase [Treponema sp.]|jgi:murein DD-endopeptidase MepM/ murein hydrolase activator NlpD|nr:M23 family metallopeptidase [Treponema sp.]